MIINRPGAEFEYEGVIYKIGEPIIGTDESEYEGLFGSITEIRDGEDKETENDTPDLYCTFEPPVLPCEIQKLEEVFSELYQQPKTLDDINLDLVIMAPSMVKPLDDLQTNRVHPVVYILTENWAIEGDYGDLSEVYSDFEDAKRVLIQKVTEEKENGCIPRWLRRSEFIEESNQKSYECYLDGEYAQNHYSLVITEQQMCASAHFTRELSDIYNTTCQLEDFASQVEDWDELERLTAEQRERMLHDRQFPERFQNALSKNEYYWECYWETMSEVAHEFLRKYLLEALRPECYTPKKNSPYPLCEGRNRTECKTCSLWADISPEQE